MRIAFALEMPSVVVKKAIRIDWVALKEEELRMQFANSLADTYNVGSGGLENHSTAYPIKRAHHFAK